MFGGGFAGKEETRVYKYLINSFLDVFNKLIVGGNTKISQLYFI